MTTVEINIDSVLSNSAEEKTGLKINELVENYLKLIINNDSVEGDLLNEMVKVRRELDKLEKDFMVVQKDKIELDSYNDLKRPFKTIKDIYNRYEEVGRDQIELLAKNHNVSAISLEQLCMDQNIPLINFKAPVR